jgi:membrane-bound ClpP family serine protease
LTLVIAWLVVILFGFSILAPRNAVAGTALIISAMAVCGAVLLLLEFYTPFDGVIRISSEPLLAALGQPPAR